MMGLTLGTCVVFLLTYNLQVFRPSGTQPGANLPVLVYLYVRRLSLRL